MFSGEEGMSWDHVPVKSPKEKMGDLQQEITNDTGIFHGILYIYIYISYIDNVFSMYVYIYIYIVYI